MPRPNPSRARVNSNRQPRLRPGQLPPLVLTHLRTHPGVDFTVPDLARALHRSRGAVTTALARLTAAGSVRQVGQHPARFTATPTHLTSPEAPP